MVLTSRRRGVESPAVTPCRIASIALFATALGGCANVIPWVVNPAGAATQTVSDGVQSLMGVNPATIAADPAADINRILRENPDAVNASDLANLRSELVNSRPAGSRPGPDDLVAERRAEHDRRTGWKGRRVSDNLLLATEEQFHQPTGLRSTPRSHYDNENLPRPRLSEPTVDLSPIRFGK